MADVPFPKLDAFFQEARRIWSRRPDVRERFQSVASLGYWNWLMGPGWCEHPELGRWLPVPPEALIGRVIGAGATADHYLASGLSDAQNIHQMLFDVAGVPPGGRILDFGCGCGRILRCLARLADTWSFAGADVDAEAIEWCRTNLDFATFTRIEPWPPLPSPAGSFDAVYAYSVFTHLPEVLHAEWLAELHRLLRPGGVLVATLLGEHGLERVRGGRNLPRFGGVTPKQLEADRQTFRTRGYLYYPYDDAGKVHGLTFVGGDYVRRHWTRLFDILELRVAPQDWQDYVALRRRSVAEQ